ncbi:hypothetical protein L3Q82_005976 [Scortum barcoo]|uniref:Uncharacterized protein n=1 Tax=Scortum barcoo TaxID=214431 RepID=A0ACB8X381_9TELE|nr:hypothetical protein L3Q82_005976 [Scortum barcoo]
MTSNINAEHATVTLLVSPQSISSAERFTDVVSPVKTVRCYPNNKPWVTREVKTVLNKKKAAFRSRDREAMKAAQQEVKHCVKEAKDSYRRKGGAEAEGKQHEGGLGRCEDHHRSQHKDQSRRGDNGERAKRTE